MTGPSPVPDPPADCQAPRIVSRGVGEIWSHVWKAEPGRMATTFNPGFGVGRFHPIFDRAGAPVATFYAASHPDAAIFESVFHDVAENEPNQQIYRSKLAGLVRSNVRLSRDIALVDLTTLGRHHVRLSRVELIEPVGPDNYLRTARWAEYFLRCTSADGLIWPSRPLDTHLSILLFGRAADAIEDAGDNTPLDAGAGLDRIYALAEEAEILVVSA